MLDDVLREQDELRLEVEEFTEVMLRSAVETIESGEEVTPVLVAFCKDGPAVFHLGWTNPWERSKVLEGVTHELKGDEIHATLFTFTGHFETDPEAEPEERSDNKAIMAAVSYGDGTKFLYAMPYTGKGSTTEWGESFFTRNYDVPEAIEGLCESN
jgi:hypothetical protein